MSKFLHLLKQKQKQLQLKTKKNNVFRRALLIGCNYTGTSSQLEGCINDINNIKAYLTTHGNFKEGDITMLSDKRGALDKELPTRKNIISEITKFVSNLPTQGRVVLFFHYSGHGSYTVDFTRDEEDGYDETIVPLDYDKNGMILDDDLKKILVDVLGSNVELYCILDCCHSGTGMDLRYSCKVNQKDRVNEYVFTHNKANLKSNAQVIMFSGCKDDQTSADAHIASKYQGAMTWAFLQILSKYKYSAVTYKTLLQEVQKLLADNDYEQIPQLSSGTFIDLKGKYLL